MTPHGNTGLKPCLRVPSILTAERTVTFPQAQEPQDYFRGLRKGNVNQNLQAFQAKSGGKSLAWLLNLERLLKV